MADLFTQETEIKVLTFNIWGIWRYSSGLLEKRLKLITEAINGFDIVNLQETFVKNTRQVLDNNTFYQSKERLNNTRFLKWSGGLSVLSRLPVTEKRHIEFGSCAGFDCNCNKGVFFLRMAVPGLGSLDVYNTHYQSMPWAVRHRLRANRDFEKFFRENDQGNPAIITGDFNFTENDPDYSDFMERFRPIDTFRVKHPEEPGYTFDRRKNPYVNFLSPLQRLDYIFAVPGENSRVEIISSEILFELPREGIFLSDHFAVMTNLKISRN
jgi:endonuclease/exonuclease/phosphatase family metal-dependent hydrolase